MNEYDILRKECHDYIDKLCETHKDRENLYKWLARKLEIKQRYCHFGLMTLPQLYKSRKLLRKRYIKEEKQ